MTTMTACWNCNRNYWVTDARCPHCCAANGNVDLAAAVAEAEDKSLIEHSDRYIEDCIGDSRVINGLHHFAYYECRACGDTKNGPRPERDPDYQREERAQ